MEIQLYQSTNSSDVLSYVPLRTEQVPQKQRSIIEANTTGVELNHLISDCTIPVFAKDNERTISHQEFIEAAMEAVQDTLGVRADILPEIRVSHPIKGRIPDAIHKSAHALLDHEKTIYYERMAFAISLDGFRKNLGGNELSLTIGGVRSYNHENLYNKKSLEHFKFFIGFKNLVCCNMCISTDGAKDDLRVGSVQELLSKMVQIIRGYQMTAHLDRLQHWTEQHLTERQFAQILGKCRLYQHLPKEDKLYIPSLLFNDTQINEVARAYFQDQAFSRLVDGRINLWKVYNLFTSANKSSYIDLFLTRGVNASVLIEGISEALDTSASPYRWYLE